MAMIFDIKRYAIHDGPGIRVTVFFKGCPLRCAWCHNPESISPKPEKMFSAAKCIGCGECVRVCPHDACRLDAGCGVVFDDTRCTLCGACAEACPTRAVDIVGREYSVDEILDIVEKQRVVLEQSGGGITVSGGEPLLQADFLIKLLDACGRRGIHRAVDTAGLASPETVLEVARHADYFLFDVKMIDPAKHKEWTGVDNRLILANLKALAETGADIEIRMPLIAGVNCEPSDIAAAADFIAALSGPPKPVALLPFHDLASVKCAKLGRPRKGHRMAAPSAADLRRIVDQFAASGLAATVGG